MSSIRAVRRQDRHAAPQYPQMFLIRHESTAVGGIVGRTVGGVKRRESRMGRKVRRNTIEDNTKNLGSKLRCHPHLSDVATADLINKLPYLFL
jgi:hypothetical protein